MKNIAVSLIVDGKFKNVLIPQEFVGELSVKLREEGKYAVHFADETVMAEGIVVLAIGSKQRVMVLELED